MVSERQRQARKRYREAHPELFPMPEPTPPKDPDKKKKKKFNRGKLDHNGPARRSFKRHPLRVPGMKPGEGCYICKAADHIAKLCPEKSKWEKNKICLLCRHRGHTLKHCPNKTDDSATESKLCYNCGGTGHSLANCPQPLQDGGTKFASCFVCKEQGHLSKNCPQNTRGIYPKGGCCKVCGGVTHLAKDCPERGQRRSSMTNGVGKQFEDGNRLRPQVTRFTSGDDLQDDFVMDAAGKKDSTSVAVVDPSSRKEGEIKSKKKGPKVINFVG